MVQFTLTILNFSGTSNFVNNSALAGGAIFANINSTLTFNEIVYFTNNGHYKGGVDIQKGGGVCLGLKCTFSTLPHTTVYWKNNHATLGGAIYAYDTSPISYCTPLAPYVPKQECFFQLPDQNLSNGMDVQLIFKNNTADAAGSVLYGGAVDNCKLTYSLDSHSSGKVFDIIVYTAMTLITTQPQTFLLTHFTSARVKKIFQTLVNLDMIFHTQYFQVKYFKFLWLQLDKEMVQFLAK